MNILRSFMLIGSLGRVWSRSRVTRNVFSSISIVAYFKLLDDYEKGITSEVIIVPDEQVSKRRVKFVQKQSFNSRERSEKLREVMRHINRTIYDN